MSWSTSSGRDLSHHNPVGDYTAARGATDWVQIKVTEADAYIDPAAGQHYRGFQGIPRGPYHFALPGSLSAQVRNFLSRKNALGGWERLDMLDCEFDGVTGAFIRDLVAEYRAQSGIRTVLVYCGVALLKTSCNPALWYDADTPIWAARYRKIGPPSGPDDWASHLGWDHPGLAIYQWDNATALPGAGLTDISAQRKRLGQENSVTTPNEIWSAPVNGKDPYDGHIEQHQACEWLTLPGYRTIRIEALLKALTAKVDAGFGALSDDEANIIAAVRAQPTGGQVDVQALAVALNQLGALTARVPDDQVEQLLAELNKIPVEVRQQLAAALAGGNPA